MKKIALLSLVLALANPIAHAAPSDSERIAQLERRVDVLTEQINRLLAERLDERRIEHRSNYPMYSCSLKAFTDTYRAQSSSRGKAILDVSQQCRAKHDDMFCQEKQVQCQTYQ